MKFWKLIITICSCSILLVNCNSQDKRQAELTLDTLVVEDPEIIVGDTNTSLFIGINEDNNLFAYLGGSQEYCEITFSELDRWISEYKKTFPDAAFAIKNCDGSKSDQIGELILKFKSLGIERFTLSNTVPCHPKNKVNKLY